MPAVASHTVTLISTGGTIETTYDERAARFGNVDTVVPEMLDRLRLPFLDDRPVELMAKDSRDMTDTDHQLIATTAHAAATETDGVVVLHGTDRLETSGEVTIATGLPPSPIVFTGAMRPWMLRDSDALQNLAEALIAVQLVPPGVYVAMHGQLLAFPGVVKDHRAGTFVRP